VDHGEGRSHQTVVTARVVEGGQVGEDTRVCRDMLVGHPVRIGDGGGSREHSRLRDRIVRSRS
jgi:hypothetical protein